jgi:hypothetical protein
MNTKSFRSLCSKTALLLVGSLTFAGVTTISHTDRANAAILNLNFSTVTQTTLNTNPFSFGFGAGVGNTSTSTGTTPTGVNSIIANYTNVGTDEFGQKIDARITATAFSTPGTNTVNTPATTPTYSVVEQIPNYTAAGNSNGDGSFLYQIAKNQRGAGGMTYEIELFTTDGTIHNYSTTYTASELRFLVYDVDGENNLTTGPGSGQSSQNQAEAVRVAAGQGFVGYQVGTSAAALTPTLDTTDGSYLFSGHQTNYLETDSSSAAILYFANTSSVTFQFEANTLAPGSTAAALTTFQTTNNPVFSAVDGDLSLIAAQNLDLKVAANATAKGYSTFVSTASSTAAPEPFTIVGTILGGTAALRMKKKLKDSEKV